MFHWVLNTSPIIVSAFSIISFRSSCSQMSFKMDALINFAIVTGKHLCWSPFLINLQDCKPANLLKSDSNTGVFLWILWNIYALASLLITFIFTIGSAISTSDNNQVKAAGKDYVNVKPVWPVCVCAATMLQ